MYTDGESAGCSVPSNDGDDCMHHEVMLMSVTLEISEQYRR
ncbi:hypothetical protein OH492_19010 [Vibrio chagasii]|nr:hypothetical protein [Vibrio chagasii]